MAGIMFEKDETAISRAIFNNDIKALKEALKSGEDPHYKDRKGNTYLHYLCTGHRPYMIHVVVGTGIDLNAQNRHGNTALHVTALQHECCHVGDLMASGINPFLKNNNGLTAAEIPTRNLFWKTIYEKYQPGIFEAITVHDVDKVLYLLHCWSRINTTRNGLTLRQFAAALKYHDLVFHIDCLRHTLGAIFAVLEGDEEKAKTFMASAKCDVNFVNHAMESKHILQDALRQHNFRLVHLICSSKVNVNVMVRIHNFIKAPLFFAALNPKLSGKIMWTVLRAGADFSLCDERGRNAAVYALDKWKGQIPIEVITFMLKNGLDITQRDETGVTLRDVARFARRQDILTLIDKAFVKLIRTSNKAELDRLCMRGYDGMLINFNYRDTFIYASGNQTEEMLEYTEWIPTFCLQVRKLFFCIRHKSLEEVIKVLDSCQKQDLLLNAVDKGGRAAIHRCVLCWRSDVLKELVKRKCDVNLQDNCGRTAYHYACALAEKDEREEICSILHNPEVDKPIVDFKGHKAENNTGNKQAQLWLAKERKTTYGMVKQLLCVDKYEEICRMMKYKGKKLKHFNALVRNFKYPVPKFEKVLQPLMPDYKDLLFIAMDAGKEDVATHLVKLGANWKRMEKTDAKFIQGSESGGKAFVSVIERAKELGMTELIEAVERQKIHDKKLVEQNKEQTEVQNHNEKRKFAKVRKMRPALSEKKDDDNLENDDDDDVLFEEEVVSDSDESDDLRDEEDKKNSHQLQRLGIAKGNEDDDILDNECLELVETHSEDTFYSDDFDM